MLIIKKKTIKFGCQRYNKGMIFSNIFQKKIFFIFLSYLCGMIFSKKISDIIERKDFTEDNISFLLGLEEPDRQILQQYAHAEHIKYHGDMVFFRGLVEISNICSKDCFYCGIRKSNKCIKRYELDLKEIMEAVNFADEHNFGSVVFQSGERSNDVFIKKIDKLLRAVKEETHGELGITLSLGEQTEKTYRRWFDSGAHRYLLRIETSNRELFTKIHPQNDAHSFDKRLECLKLLKKTGYQTGTGVMIGLPEQTLNDLANDILFFKEMDIDMVGMGPYIEHKDTPLFAKNYLLQPIQKRFETALNMIAVTRLVLPDINIASATALQAINPFGRELALQWGANIIMPNITPTENRKNYQLYKDKPGIYEGAEETITGLLARIEKAGKKAAFGEWGDSKHYFNRSEVNFDNIF